MNSNKDLNIKCICGKIDYKTIKISMIMPCEHIFHTKCLDDKELEFCPICNTEIEGRKHMTDPIKTYEDAQRYSDMLSVTNFSKLSTYSISDVVDNLIDLTKILISAPFCKGIKDSRKVLGKFLSLNNTNIHVRGLDRINKKEKHAFICNHTTYMDFMVVLMFIDTYFLASDFINKSSIGASISKVIPLLIIKRGETTNTVDKMKEFIDKHGSICLFPEGVLCHPETIIKFRTGAFYLDVPIYPIVLRYKNIKHGSDIANFIFKSSSRHHVDIYMDVIGPYYPPFNKAKIERIRSDMANVGNMLTSRVSSRNITERD